MHLWLCFTSKTIILWILHKICMSADSRVNGWLLFNTKLAIFQLYHGKYKIHSMRWWCKLCTRPAHLVGSFIVLAHWNNRSRVDMSFHLGTFSRIWANKTMLLLINAVCLAEKQQIAICLIWPRFEPTIYSTRGKHKSH